MLKYILSISTIIILSGCATKTIGPLAAGENTYIISREEGAFPTGSEPLLEEALAKASSFCSNQNKNMKLINSQESRQIIGAYPKATVTFSCENKSSDN